MKRSTKLTAMCLFFGLVLCAMPAAAAGRSARQHRVSPRIVDFFEIMRDRFANEVTNRFPALAILRETRRAPELRTRDEGPARRSPSDRARLGRDRDLARPRFRVIPDVP